MILRNTCNVDKYISVYLSHILKGSRTEREMSDWLDYSNYICSLNKKDLEHENSKMYMDNDEDKKTIFNHDKTNEINSSIKYLEITSIQQKQKQQNQHFQIEQQQHQLPSTKTQPASSNNDKLFSNNLINTAKAKYCHIQRYCN